MIVRRMLAVGLLAALGWGGLALEAVAEEKQITLKLGGKFCEFYLGEVEKALKGVAGVQDVDLKSQKGHAVVTIKEGTAKPKDLTAAVDGVKGDGWHCKGEVK
jgi:periplasmic mercuric ion binding protein